METTSEKKLKLFTLILTPHRLWGLILVPYIITDESKKRYYKLTECLSPFPNIDTLSLLRPEEREVVKILNDYSDRNLYKLFSKDKSVKEFLEVVTREKIDTIIRPYIEQKIYKCLTIARDEEISVYYQKAKSGTLHSEDRLVLNSDDAVPVFVFSRENEQSTYNLSLEAGGKKIDLLNSSVDIVCMSPCLIREDHRILFVSDVDGSKIRPFLSRENIIIPKKTEKKYFETFVLNAVNNFRVENHGFAIEHCEPEKTAILELDSGIRGYPVLILRFRYEDHLIYPDDTVFHFTRFSNDDAGFIFRKYNRDFDWEKKCLRTLGELGFFSDDDISFLPFSGENKKKDDLYSLIEVVNDNYGELVDAGFTLHSRLNQQYNLKQVSIEISSELINDWFDLKAIVKIGEWEIPFSHFRKNILSGNREYVLPDGSVAVLPEAWFSRYRNIFEFGKSQEGSLLIHKQHFALLSDTFSDDGKMGLEKLGKLLELDKIPVIDPPEGLRCEMRHYQAEGLNWLNFLQSAGLGGCLADDMGLGKTIQTLALLQHNRENAAGLKKEEDAEELSLFSNSRPPLTSLIIVPASLIYNWENEIRRFVPSLKVCSYKGNQRKKFTSYFRNFDVILSSYHTIRQDVEIIKAFRFHYIILDESQVIKNPSSMLYKTVTSLMSDYKLVLTGTPVENSLTDLWTQLNFVNPGLLGELSFFRREFAKPIENAGDDEKELKLRKIIQPFILRRTKEMVARDLPPITEQTVYCDMTDEQEKYYEEEKSLVRNSILKSMSPAAEEKSAIIVLQGLMKLRLISNHPVMTIDDYCSGSGKFETVLQDIESVISEGHKLLVFSSFVKHLGLFAGELTRKRIKYAILTGSSTNREKIVNSFQNDPSNKVFLISLKAGGVGLNLTAADYVFILDPWWNPASEMQALNRAHRIGQDKSVFVYRYITSNTIEEKITRLQEKKSKLAETFISSNNPLKDIDIQEILDIIG